MRQLIRPSVKLPTLEEIDAQGNDWKVTGKDVPAPDRWNNVDVRGALYAMHGRSCAYCQRELPGNDRGDVEHFRPQSKYQWLMYVYDNYFLACSTCNRVRKGSKFPFARKVSPVSYENRHLMASEPILLLNPIDDPVESWIEFDFNKDIYPARPQPNLEVFATTRVAHTIEFFRLNTDLKLIKARMMIVGKTLELLKSIAGGDENAKLELRNLASRYCPHGIVVRKLLENYKSLLLPTREDDLRGLIDDLLFNLTIVDKIRQSEDLKGPKQVELRKAEAELYWALAVLWRSPPVSTPDNIESWIEKAGRLDQVKPYYVKLQ